MNLNSLFLQYTYQKLTGGYEPNSTNDEIVDFLYYFEQFISLTTTELNINFILENIDGKKLVKTKEFLITPTYNFSDKDLISPKKINYKRAREIEIIINEYLKKLPKRSPKYELYINSKNSKKMIAKSSDYDMYKEEIEFAEHTAALYVEFIWNNYIDSFIEAGKWPTQCRDINKYLFENDLACMIEIPSIRDKILMFYRDTVEKILTLKKEDPNFKISRVSDSLLAKANSDFIISGYEQLFECSKKRTIEIDAKSKTFTNRACPDGVFVHKDVIYNDLSLRKEKIGSAKTKKLVEKINNL